MNKYLVRIVAFLLIPCLVADPATAGGLRNVLSSSRPLGVNQPPLNATRVQEEALQMSVVFCTRPLLHGFVLDRKRFVQALRLHWRGEVAVVGLIALVVLKKPLARLARRLYKGFRDMVPPGSYAQFRQSLRGAPQFIPLREKYRPKLSNIKGLEVLAAIFFVVFIPIAAKIVVNAPITPLPKPVLLFILGLLYLEAHHLRLKATYLLRLVSMEFDYEAQT